MSHGKKLSYALLLCIFTASTSGCALLGGLFSDEGGDRASIPDEESLWLYMVGVKRMFTDNVQRLRLQKTHKVWVVNMNGGGNGDGELEAATYDSIVTALKESNCCAVVEKDEDMVRDLYVEFTESKKLDIKSDDLVRGGKLLNADMIVAYRVLRIDKKTIGCIVNGIMQAIAGFVDLFSDMDVNTANSLRIGMHVQVIHVGSGLVTDSFYLEHSEDQPNQFVAEKVLTY